ncbi:hypothetical protein SAMN05444157_3790 [Frankineae bacterium MT45]|nr:hypothetical protein SAMN05444157_3790 [Frankineae bacterium MT45]
MSGASAILRWVERVAVAIVGAGMLALVAVVGGALWWLYSAHSADSRNERSANARIAKTAQNYVEYLSGGLASGSVALQQPASPITQIALARSGSSADATFRVADQYSVTSLAGSAIAVTAVCYRAAIPLANAPVATPSLSVIDCGQLPAEAPAGTLLTR